MPEPKSSGTSETDDTSATRTFRLTCTDCSFETAVDGNSRDALEEAEAHQAEYGGPLVDHFVNFTAVDT